MAIIEAEPPFIFSKSLKTTIRLLAASTAITVPNGFIIWRDNGVDYFGNTFTQDLGQFYITKADLPGLIPSANNSAEEIFAALLYKMLDAKPGTAIGKLEVSVWKTLFKPSGQARIKVTIFEVKVLLPVQYTYEFVEICNSDDNAIVKYL